MENWPTPFSITEVRSFVGLASFYRINKGKFEWSTEATKSFAQLEFFLSFSTCVRLTRFFQAV